MAEDLQSADSRSAGTVPVDSRTFTACMEQLQEGYVASVAATAGCVFEPVRRDIYGFDATLTRPPQVIGEQESQIFVQLKNTTTKKPNRKDATFGFRLKKREYFETLAARRSYPKAILVVMVTPPVQELWTEATHDYLQLNHCCYWVSLEGQTARQSVQGPTVQIPTTNIFDARSLIKILNKVDRGESLS